MITEILCTYFGHIDHILVSKRENVTCHTGTTSNDLKAKHQNFISVFLLNIC